MLCTGLYNDMFQLRLHHRDQISYKVGRTADGKQFSNTLWTMIEGVYKNEVLLIPPYSVYWDLIAPSIVSGAGEEAFSSI